MDNYNESSPATSGYQTFTVPVESGWGQMGGQMGLGFNVPWQQLMGMMVGAPGGMPGGVQASGGQSAPGWGGIPQMQQ